MSVPAFPPLSVVTGAGSGIGLALAHALLERRHEVVAIDLDVSAIDPRADRHGLDVRDAAAMEAVTRRYAGRPVQYVFANAGIGAGGDVLSASDAAWQWAWEVNVLAPIRTLRQWWPHLREGQGKAVATVSSAALQSYPGAGPYRATKAALLAALEGLHYEARGSGVTVHALCPGMVRSQVTDGQRYAEAAQLAPEGDNPFARYVRQAMAHAESAEAFAERVLDTLWEGAPFYWFTHPETRDWIVARHRAIESGGRPFSDFTPAAR